MAKIFAFITKELTTLFRDRTALLLVFAAPLVLTLIMGAAFSGLSGGGGLTAVPLVVVNLDEGPLGAQLVEVLQAPALAELLEVTVATDAAAARAQVDADEVAGALIFPANLTEQVQGNAGSATAQAAQLEVYTNPGRPIGSGVVQSLAQRLAQQLAAGRLGASVTLAQLLQSGRLTPDQLAEAATAIGQRAATESVNRQLITFNSTIAASAPEAEAPNVITFFAPGIAVLFLMFSMAAGGRSLLVEHQNGTLARLRASPTNGAVILLGKISGVLFSGWLQLEVFILVSTLFMGVGWGDPLGVGVLMVLVVAATAALGMVIASLARTLSQANTIGSAVVMTLAAIGGNFIPRQQYPEFLRYISYIGPNAWALEGFAKLANGATLADLGLELGALGLMTLVFFGIALVGFRKLVNAH